MIEMKTVAPQQQNSLLLTMADLHRKRIELNMSRRVAAKYLGISHGLLYKYERENLAPQHIFEYYRNYLENCANGKIYYRHIKVFSPRNIINPVPKKNLLQIRAIRRSLKIRQKIAARVIDASATILSNRERGRTGMLQSEYDALMKFYRQEKLKRIFGSHYREGTMS